MNIPMVPILATLVACGRSTTPEPLAAETPPRASTVESDPLLLAARVGLELINAKGEQVRTRADVYESDVFSVSGQPVAGADCRASGESAKVLSASPGEPIALTIVNRRDEPFVPHVIEYRREGLEIVDLVEPVPAGKTTTACFDAPSTADDFLIRVVGTRVAGQLEDTVMYGLARDIAAENPDNTEARALATLLENENRQRLTLARLMEAQGQALPAEMVLGRMGADATPADARAILELPANVALLVYAEIDGALTAAWYETGRDAFAARLEVTPSEVSELVDGFVASLAGANAVQRAPVPRGLERVVVEPPEVATPSELSRALLPALVRDRLAAVESVVIVPVGPLGRVPWFAVEVDDEPLVASHAVTIAPDLVALDASPRPWSRSFEAPLVVGDPVLTREDFPEWDLPPLPGAAAEARAVAAALGAEPLVGEAATRDGVLDRIERSDLIYLATHGVADRTAPLWDSFVALNQGGWRAVDVLTADLDHASLAVLSACQTGLGQDVDAGTIGLARSFYKAGVPRVVMSLWNVDDEGTKTLMLSFVDALATVPPAEALRRAADAMRRDGAPPAVWASFSLMGHPR